MTARWLLCIILLGVPGCAASPNHPPTFAQIQPQQHLLSQGSEADWQRAIDVADSEQFSPQDIARVRSMSQAGLLAGAGIQERSEADGIALLHQALDLDPHLVVAHVSVIDFEVGLILDSKRPPSDTATLPRAVEHFRRLEPSNGLGDYVLAWQLPREDRKAESLQSIQRGNAAPTFASYSTQRFLAVRDAGEAAGFPRSVANHHAMGFVDPMKIYRAMLKTCEALSAGADGGAARRACFAAGQRVELASGNVLETLMGLLLQTHAVQGSGWNDEAGTLAALDNRRDAIVTLEDAADGPHDSEADWNRYFDVFAAQGEEAAMRSRLSTEPTTPSH
jgi:hypothetical protein